MPEIGSEAAGSELASASGQTKLSRGQESGLVEEDHSRTGLGQRERRRIGKGTSGTSCTAHEVSIGHGGETDVKDDDETEAGAGGGLLKLGRENTKDSQLDKVCYRLARSTDAHELC